jgi:hypothetical protein
MINGKISKVCEWSPTLTVRISPPHHDGWHETMHYCEIDACAANSCPYDGMGGAGCAWNGDCMGISASFGKIECEAAPNAGFDGQPGQFCGTEPSCCTYCTACDDYDGFSTRVPTHCQAFDFNTCSGGGGWQPIDCSLNYRHVCKSDADCFRFGSTWLCEIDRCFTPNCLI